MQFTKQLINLDAYYNKRGNGGRQRSFVSLSLCTIVLVMACSASWMLFFSYLSYDSLDEDNFYNLFSAKQLCQWYFPYARSLLPERKQPLTTPTAPSINAAIVYLAEFKEEKSVIELTKSLEKLYLHFLKQNALYPVLIFYEPSDHARIQPSLVAQLECAVKNLTLSNQSILRFLEASDFYEIPPGLPPIPQVVSNANMGYRHMCRFWAYGVFQHPAISALEYYWRLDTDLFLIRDIKLDPFQWMRSAHLAYVYAATELDAPEVVTGLWATTLEYMRRNAMHPRTMRPLANHVDGLDEVSTMPLQEAVDLMLKAGYNLLIYYNNFEVSRSDIWRSQEYLAYFAALDASGGIFLTRWGDAPIRTLALHMLDKPKGQWPGLCYFHAGTKAT